MKMMNEHLSVATFFLTLSGLIGTFFYIHLSNWLREVLALHSQFKRYSHPTNMEEKKKLYSLEYDLIKNRNPVFFVISVVVSLFVISCTVASVVVLLGAPASADYRCLLVTISTSFLLIYILLSGGIMIYGEHKSRESKKLFESALELSRSVR